MDFSRIASSFDLIPPAFPPPAPLENTSRPIILLHVRRAGESTDIGKPLTFTLPPGGKIPLFSPPSAFHGLISNSTRADLRLHSGALLAPPSPPSLQHTNIFNPSMNNPRSTLFSFFLLPAEVLWEQCTIRSLFASYMKRYYSLRLYSLLYTLWGKYNIICTCNCPNR